MADRTDSFDIGRLHLTSGEARRLELGVEFEPYQFGGQEYLADPADAVVDVSRMTGEGYSMRLRFITMLNGPCTRCLDPLGIRQQVDSREIDQPGGGDDLTSPYMENEVLDLKGWARDALVLALPSHLAGELDKDERCITCNRTLADLTGQEPEPEKPEAAGPEPDPRWAKLSELKFD